jgi:hypothetical protein
MIYYRGQNTLYGRLLILSNAQSTKMPKHLGDFTLTPRMLLIIALSVIAGIISAFLAVILQALIGLFTNLVFYQ